MRPVREKISQEEAYRLKKQREKASIEATLQKIAEKPLPDNSAVLAKLDTIASLLAKFNITVEAPDAPIIDTTPIAREITTALARLQHEIAKLESKSVPLRIEFTRNTAGYIQSPIIVKPVE